MSLAFAESFDRLPVGATVTHYTGPLGKAIDARWTNLINVAGQPTIASYLGRKWLRTSFNTYTATGASPLRFLLGLYADLANETMRTQPVLPALGNSARVIYQWKISSGGVSMNGGNAWFGEIAGQYEFSYGFTVGENSLPTKGYWQVMMIHDIGLKRARLFVDGVQVRTVTLTGTSTQFLLNMNPLAVRNASGSLIPTPVFMTDLIVIYDDGVWPSVPLGDATVRDVRMELSGSAHADAEFVAGQNILTADVKGAPVGLRLVGANTNATFQSAASQPSLSADPVSAFLVDTIRGPGTVAGDLEAKIQTASGSNSRKESPVALNSNLQAVIRVPTKALTIQGMRDNLRVDLACRAR